MYFSIKYKILLTLVVSTIAVVGGMWLLVAWSFDRGLVRYVSSVEQEVKLNLVQALADEYRRDAGWGELTANPERWRELQVESFLDSEAGRRKFAMPLPPPEVRLPPAGEERRPPPRHMRFHLHRSLSRTVLLDAERRSLLGRTDREAALDYSPIVVDGETVGYLGLLPPPQPFDRHERQFSRRQTHAFMAIAAVMVAVSTLMLFPISRQLVRPITELSRATRELASGRYGTRIRISTHDELGRLSADFNTLAKTLEDNERSRRQWIADISHELRTPLSVLQGEIEAMEDGLRECTPERLRSLHQQTTTLSRLVNDLYELSLSDVGALSYQRQSVGLAALIQACVEDWRETFAARNIDLRLPAPAGGPHRVFGDPSRLRQLLFNLLDNSHRYTDPGGVVEVRLSAAAGEALIDIQDSAPGVAERHLPHLFERLYRVEDSRSRSTGGSGLGLAICRSIVDAHHGRITAQASPLGGLWIRVALPLEA